MRKKIKGGLKKKKTYFIFGEGETEKCYFSALNEYLGNDNSINYKIEPIKYEQIGTTKIKLEETKKTIFNKIYQEYNGITKKDLLDFESKIFIVLDTDGPNGYIKTQIDTIKNFFKKDDLINVLFSNKDFELYILLHLQYYNGTNSDYISIIKEKFPGYKKGCNIKLKNIHREIIKNGFDKTLTTNIKKLKKYHISVNNNHIKDMIPFTEVYNIFEN